MIWLQAICIAGFVAVHLFSGRLRFLDVRPRSRWLSLAGGTSVAYVFIHVFPELAAAQVQLGEEYGVIPYIEHHAYLVALFGLAVFYGLERRVRASQQERGETPGPEQGETTTGLGVFWLHVASLGLYNALIGYLLVHREDENLRGLYFYAIAMGLHFLVNDYGLRHDHKNTYRRMGRWILSAAIVIGWVMGLATQISDAATGALFAFLAGGVILNVLKEELPEERASRFVPFAVGAGGYAVLLLL